MSVEWTHLARERMADIYVRLPSVDAQRAFVRFIEQTEQRLRDGSQFLGESRADPQHRIWFTGKLSLVFRLIPGKGVMIVHIHPLKHGAVNDDDGPG